MARFSRSVAAGDAKTRGRTAEGGGQDQLLSDWMFFLLPTKWCFQLLVIPSPTIELLLRLIPTIGLVL